MLKITLQPSQILPSQEYLKPKTLKYILDCLDKQRFEKLPPNPVVRLNIDGNYVAIDGHNLIAVCLYKNTKIEVFVSENTNDLVPSTVEGSTIRNKELREKFDQAPAEYERVCALGIQGFADLLALYPTIFKY